VTTLPGWLGAYALDDDTLAVLANRGLVRRANKEADRLAVYRPEVLRHRVHRLERHPQAAGHRVHVHRPEPRPLLERHRAHRHRGRGHRRPDRQDRRDRHVRHDRGREAQGRSLPPSPTGSSAPC